MKKLKKIGKILIVFLLVFLLTGCTKQLVVEKTNDKGKKTKTVVRYIEGKNATGQSLTENIICKPTNKDVVKIYKENGVKISKLPDCDDFNPLSNYEGLWTSIFVKPLAWVILKIGQIFKSYGLSIIITCLLIRLILMCIT